MSQPSTEQTIAKIEIDRELCIGAATCVALAPEVFDLDKENKALVKPNYRATDETIFQAAAACPVYAIYLYNQAGKRMYPSPETN